MKGNNLRTDTDGIFPLLIGIAIAGVASWFGFTWLTGGTDPWEFFKVIIIGSLVFIIGLIALMGKFVVIPKPWGLLVGLGCLVGSIYYIWRGL